MKQTVYIATVQIAVVSSEEAEACDAISECLSGNLLLNGAIVDWQYVDKEGIYSPEIAGEYDLSEVEEGEIINTFNTNRK